MLSAKLSKRRLDGRVNLGGVIARKELLSIPDAPRGKGPEKVYRAMLMSINVSKLAKTGSGHYAPVWGVFTSPKTQCEISPPPPQAGRAPR